MATFTVSVKMYDAANNDFSWLETAMQNENFILLRSAAYNERQFVYYGNKSLVAINDTVAKLAASAGSNCSFVASKDMFTQHQYHQGYSSLYSQTA